jgi:hypothetical protein
VGTQWCYAGSSQDARRSDVGSHPSLNAYSSNDTPANFPQNPFPHATMTFTNLDDFTNFSRGSSNQVSCLPVRHWLPLPHIA